jgi:ribosomal RNA-processing protein 17
MSNKTSTNSLTFDFDSRKEYVTGFKKRKEERRVRTQIQTEFKQKRVKREKKIQENLEKKKEEEAAALLNPEVIPSPFVQEAINIADVKVNKYENKNSNVTVQVQAFDFNDSEPEEEEVEVDYSNQPQISEKELIEQAVQNKLKRLKHHPEKKKKNANPRTDRINGKKQAKYQKLRDRSTRFTRKPGENRKKNKK